jgi:putative serine protease PepD
MARWSADPTGSRATAPGHSGALYDASGAVRANASGVPQNGAPIPPSSGGPSRASAWWSDAESDPWRDPYAPSAVVVGAPEPEPVPEPDAEPPGRRVTLSQVLLISALCALLAGAIGGALGYVAAVRGGLRGTVSLGAGGGSAPAAAQRAPQSLAGIAKAVLPSVVTVRVDGQLGSAIGTGFIVSNDGYLITNDHVVDGLNGTATVIFNDSTTAAARLVGADADADIAVLKVDRTGLPPVTFGDSDTVAVGDPVLAFGAPLDLPGTVTYGIISALHRPLEVADGDKTRYYSAIQTDAAVNHGNSGGPLVDSAGRVIGVNAVIKSLGASDEEAGSIGLAFAIPIDQAKRVAQSIINTGRSPHTMIGVIPVQSYHNADGGVELQSVTTNGPAARAGLEPADVILTIGGTLVSEPGDITAVIRAYAPGSVVPVMYLRGATRRTVQVTLDSN